MKKILIISILLLMPLVSFAQWDDCPHGKTDGSCEYPGECGLYTDTNNDNICDHSQEAPVTIENTQQVNEVATTTDSKVTAKNTKAKRYPIFIIAAIISILYGFTYILAKNKTITVLTHRKIWNGVLTLSFIGVALSGTLLILQINAGRIFELPFNLLYWHVITGIVMMVVALFHIGWHWRYYKNFFKK